MVSLDLAVLEKLCKGAGVGGFEYIAIGDLEAVLGRVEYHRGNDQRASAADLIEVVGRAHLVKLQGFLEGFTEALLGLVLSEQTYSPRLTGTGSGSFLTSVFAVGGSRASRSSVGMPYKHPYNG